MLYIADEEALGERLPIAKNLVGPRKKFGKSSVNQLFVKNLCKNVLNKAFYLIFAYSLSFD